MDSVEPEPGGEAYVHVRGYDGVIAETKELVPGEVFADYDSLGRLVGVEVLVQDGAERHTGKMAPCRHDPSNWTTLGCMQHHYEHVVGRVCFICHHQWFFEDDWRTDECRNADKGESK